MAWSGKDGRWPRLIVPAILLIFLACGAYAEDIFLDWDVAVDSNIKPASVDQPVCMNRFNYVLLSSLNSPSPILIKFKR